MKKRIVLFCLIVVTSISQGQKLSYGVILGGEILVLVNNTGAYSFRADQDIIPNLGGYLEYGFNKNIGLKTEVTFNTKKATYSPHINNPTNKKYPFTLNLVEVNPSIKFDFGKEYHQGFYMLLGPKFSFITKSRDSKDNDADAIFEDSTQGVQLGLGTRIGRFVDFETKFDYEITPFFKVPNSDRQSNFGGLYMSLQVDLESIINSKK
jgi:hypothetical protein